LQYLLFVILSIIWAKRTGYVGPAISKLFFRP
jgi:hypothetical protein